MAALLVLAAFLQSEESIAKSHKEVYQAALRDYAKAAEALDSDPRQALEILGRLLENDKVAKRECKIRFEQANAGWGPWSDFFPYQLRGRVRLKLADKGENAERNLEDAIRDFEESKKRGLASSDPLLKQTQKRLEDLRKVDPEPEFQREWRRLLGERDFRKAKDHFQTKGGFLSESKRPAYLSEFRDALGRSVEEFFRALATVSDARLPTDLLPPREDLLETTPAYDWCDALMTRLRSDPGSLLDHAVAAPDPRGLVYAERIAFGIVRSRLEALVTKAKNLPAEPRARCVEEVSQLLAQWKSYDAKLGTGRLPELETIRSRLPVDAPELNALVADLGKTARAENPDRALAEIEARLAKSFESWDRFTVESRAALLTYRIVAAALRGFLRDWSTDRIVSELEPLRAKAREVDGPAPLATYGPKVRKVLERLRE